MHKISIRFDVIFLTGKWDRILYITSCGHTLLLVYLLHKMVVGHVTGN